MERKIDDAAFQKHKGTLILSELILTQKRTTRGKVYNLHAPEVECIATICGANRAASAKPMAGAKPRGPAARARGRRTSLTSSV